MEPVFLHELFDALPVSLIGKHGPQLISYDVSIDQDNTFKLQPKAISEHLCNKIKERKIDLQSIYQTEINLGYDQILQNLYDVLEKSVILIADYGHLQSAYYHPERCNGTLKCHINQTMYTDPLKFTGACDITADVDFTSLGMSATKHGFDITGYTTQAYFLGSLNITDWLQKLSTAEEQLQATSAIKVLMLPQMMGEQIKWLGISKNVNTELTGFNFYDLKNALIMEAEQCLDG